MVYALNDLLASFVFIDCIIVWKFMLKCVLRVRIKIYIYIVECRQHKHDNQSYDTSKSRSLAISTNKILKVLKPIPEEHHKI